jgi:hypothetical protein
MHRRFRLIGSTIGRAAAWVERSYRSVAALKSAWSDVVIPHARQDCEVAQRVADGLAARRGGSWEGSREFESDRATLGRAIELDPDVAQIVLRFPATPRAQSSRLEAGTRPKADSTSRLELRFIAFRRTVRLEVRFGLRASESLSTAFQRPRTGLLE